MAKSAKLITWAHNSIANGHHGMQCTWELLKDKYWWPFMCKDVNKFAFSCAWCAQSTVPRPAEKLLPMPNRPWSHITIDFVIDLLISDGKNTILVLVDRFSKAIILVALPQLPTALRTTKLLFIHVFKIFHIPEDIVSDRGTQFIARVW